MHKDFIQSLLYLMSLVIVLVTLKALDMQTGFFSDLAATIYTSLIG